MEKYCALCGVGFGIFTSMYNDDYNEEQDEGLARLRDVGRVTDDDVSWTYDFVALRRQPAFRDLNDSQKTGATWYLSGIGVNDTEDLQAPPPGHDAREREEEQAETEGDAVVAFTNCGDDDEIAYPMHPVCWDLFLQNHALVLKGKPNLDSLGDLFAKQEVEYDDSSDNGSCGLRPDWMPDHKYGEVELFWGDETSGWSYLEEPWASQIAYTAWNNPKLDYLVYDPTKLLSFETLFQNPFFVKQNPRGAIAAPKEADESIKSSSAADLFSKLPPEICTMLFCHLSSQSVTNARLASRSLATVPLTSLYWRSRFEWPNELSHIKLPTLPREDVNWRELCPHLMQYPLIGTTLKSPTAPSPRFSVSPAEEQGLMNRRRILRLTRRLVDRLLAIENAEST